MRGLALLLILVAAPAAAQVRLVEAGIVCPGDRDGVEEAAPDTEAGFVTTIEEAVAFDLPDRVVPTLEKLSFGIRVALKDGAGATPITVTTTHPPMGPRAVTRQAYRSSLVPGDTSLKLYTFDLPYERVPGRWTFGIEIAGETVLEVPFDVVDRFGNARVDQVCLGNLSS